MKRFSTLFIAAAVALVGSWFAPDSAEAQPGFARQVGVSCSSCHFQYIPKLNSFGREFKLGGMTQTGTDLIEDEALSIPATANVGIIVKYRYRKTDPRNSTGEKTGTDRGVLDMADEVALFIGGRIGENWGYITEGATPDTNNKVIYSRNFGGVQGGVTVFSTEGGGPAYGMELWNTGSYRFHRAWENRSETHIQQLAKGPGRDAASGVGIFAGNQLFFANVSMWGAAVGSDIDTNTDLATYYRLALTPQVWEGLDLMIGVQGTSGEFKESSSGSVTATKTKNTTFDLQAQTEVGGMSLEVQGAYLINPKENLYNGGTKDEKGWHLGATLGVISHGGLKANYLDYTDNGSGGKYNATSFGGWYAFAQNIELQLEYTTYGGTDRTKNNYLLLMLEFGV